MSDPDWFWVIQVRISRSPLFKATQRLCAHLVLKANIIIDGDYKIKFDQDYNTKRYWSKVTTTYYEPVSRKTLDAFLAVVWVEVEYIHIISVARKPITEHGVQEVIRLSKS